MRLTNLALVLFLCCSICEAQDLYSYQSSKSDFPQWVRLMYSGDPDPGQVIAAYEAYYAQNSFIKNSHTQYYKRWLRELSRAHATDGGQPSDRAYLALRRTEQVSSRNGSALWQSIGPFDWDHEAADKSYAPGAAHVYCVEQATSDPNVLYAATATTGIWKSMDHGENWTCVTHDLLVNGTTTLEINHADAQVVYVEMLSGIYKTLDGGSTWQETGDALFQGTSVNSRDIRMHPTDSSVVFAATQQGLFRTLNGGTTWTSVLGGDILELEFHPQDPDTIYAVRNTGDVTEFFRSLNGGTSFAQQITGWPVPDIPSGEHQRRTELAVSAAAPDKVFALATGTANGGSGLYGMYVSSDLGVTWQFQCCGPQPAGPPSASNQNLMGWSDEGLDDGGQYYYDLGLDVSPTNADSIFVAGVNFWVSGDGGISFVCPAKWSHSYKPNYVHADIHDVHYFAESGEMWVAGDGGIFHSDDNGANFTRRIHGITGTDFWGFGAGNWEGDIMLGGTYHNGTLLKDNDTYVNGWISTDGGDNYRGYVHPTMDRVVYSDYNIKTLSGDRLIPNATRGFSYKPNATYTTGKSSDMLFDPTYEGSWLSGSGTTLWRTEDNGFTFTAVHDFGEDIASMAQCFSDPGVIYVTTFPGWWDVKRIYRTIDAGETWTEITPGSTQLNGNTWVPYDIEVSSTDPLKVWILRTSMYGGTNLNGVAAFESSDGGTTWSNISTPALDGQAFTCLMHQSGVEDALYVGTRRGVFYRDASLGDWEIYSLGLPASIQAVKFMPYYRKGKIRVGTNRSVWERSFYSPGVPVAQASVLSASHGCVLDTVYFKDRSVVSDDNVFWEWTFPGGMPATSNARNPKVVYGEVGWYDVVLTVSDANGSSTRTFEHMLEVKDDCTRDTIPGKAMYCGANPDHLVIDPFNITSSDFTISAWIKPDGIQNDYSGIVINDGTTAGFNFRGGNNSLGYHWPGGEWWWDSGLIVKPGDWSYVAMVVTPGQVRLSVNGVESAQSISLATVTLEQMRVGSYRGWTDRNFSGEIDEVTIWNRALTLEEIRLGRHLVKDPDNDPSIIGYFQFNSDNNIEYNKAAGPDGHLNGAASRVASRIPVGAGVSEYKNLSTTGTHTYSEAGLILHYHPATTMPGGDVYATRLHVPPDTVPPGVVPLDKGYWILNNYAPLSIPAPDSLKLLETAFISDQMASTLSSQVFTRIENAFNTGWSSTSGIGTMLPSLHGGVIFDSFSSMTRMGQVLATRDSLPYGLPSVAGLLPGMTNDAMRGGSSLMVNLTASSAKGLALPILNTSDLESMPTPQGGLLGFHEETGQLIYSTGNQWKFIKTIWISGVGTQPMSTTGQGISVGVDSVSESAILQLAAHGGMVMLSRFDSGQMIDIDFPAPGLIVMDTTDNVIRLYDGTDWKTLPGLDAAVAMSGQAPSDPVPGFVVGSSTKNPNAIFEVSSDTRGLGIPVAGMTTIANPVRGLLIFDPNLKVLCVFDGQSWRGVMSH